MSTAYITPKRWVMVAVVAGLVLTGARPGTSAADSSYANRSRVFGLAEAGASPGEVRFAPARKVQTGGPETVRPADVGRYVTLTFAPGAVIRASAPVVENGVTDYVRGVRVSPAQLNEDLRRLHRRIRPPLDRSHMFELWFDGQGRIVRMQHYFSP